MFDQSAHIAALKTYRDELDAIISALETLGTSTGAIPKKRGRPAKNHNVLPMPQVKHRGRPKKISVPVEGEPATPARKKRTFSPAQRKEQAARMKKFWAAKRRAAKAVAATA